MSLYCDTIIVFLRIIHMLTDSNFHEAKNSIVMFCSDSCAPCKQLSARFDEIKIPYFKANVDDCPLSAQRYSVRSLPTTIKFDSNMMPKEIIVGAQRDSAYLGMVG